MTTSGADHSDALEGRGSGAAVVAAVMGLVPAVFLGSLRFFLIDEPRDSEQFFGNVAFGLTYVAPYLLVLMASKVRSPAARGALLAVFGLLSLAASFSGLLSLVSLVLLPATFAIWFRGSKESHRLGSPIGDHHICHDRRDSHRHDGWPEFLRPLRTD